MKNILKQMNLCLVTSPVDGIRSIVNDAILGGVTCVQLRDKCTDMEFLIAGRELKRVTDLRGVPLILNDRWHLVNQIGAAGVHLGKRDANPTYVRKIIGIDKIIGVSVTGLHQLEWALSHNPDYIGVGPIFRTQSKKDAATPMGIKALKRIVQQTPRHIPVVAIGGINTTTVSLVRSAGASGVAVIGAIIRSQNAMLAAKLLK